MASCAACFFAGGCFDEVEPGTRADGLTISLFSGELQTRAFNDSFESYIDHFDFFFFKDAAGTQPIPGMHARVENASQVTLNTAADGPYAALRKGDSYVYILANYDGELSHENRDWTLSQLKALPVNSKIVKEKKTKWNPISEKYEETGEVVFCDYLVMDSYNNDHNGAYTVKLSPTSYNENKEVTILLTRIAAKLTMKINVAQEVQGKLPDEIWTPVRKDLKAYFVNSLNDYATVSAEPIRRTNNASAAGYEYLAYPVPYPMTPNPATSAESNYTFQTDPMYTYPQEWKPEDNGEPYFKIQMPWLSNLRGTANMYYKVTVPKPETGVFTINRNSWYQVELNLSVLDTDNNYITVTGHYTVTPWATESPSTQGGNGLSSARFFDVPTTEYKIYSDSELSIPFSSSSTVSACFTQIKYTYYGDRGGTPHEYVWNYSADDEVTSIPTLPTTDSNGNTVPAEARETNSYTLSVRDKFVDFSHPLEDVYTIRTITLRIKNQAGDFEDVTIVQHPAIEIKTHSTLNAFVNGRFARATSDVQDADGNLMGVGPYTAERFGGGQFYHATTEWNTTYSGSTHSYPRVGNNKDSFGGLGIVYGDCYTSVDADCMFLTEVTVSAFSQGSDSYQIVYSNTETKQYRIGDPRVPASTYYDEESFNIPPYLYSDKTHRDPVTGEQTVGEDVERNWVDPLSILIANKSSNACQIIAPRFLVSSNMNNMSQWSLTNANAVRRAATYQEAGYPAGRWRLPTEAEIAYIMTLQQKGVIPELYAKNNLYHCANGQVKIMGDGSVNQHQSGSSAYIRFIYDLWYWGDTPMDVNVYHPNMHEH